MIGIATFGLLIALASGQQQTAGNDKAVEAKDQPKPKPSVTTSTVKLPEHGTQTSSQQRDTSSSPTLPPKANGLGFGDYVNLATLIFTGLFLWFTILTWRQMVRANDHAEKTYEESTRETQESLDLTRKGQADTARAVAVAEGQLQAVIHAARAWITIDRIETFSAHGNGVPILVDVTFKNTGHSPAINAALSGHCFAEARDIIPGKPGPEEIQNPLHSNVTFGAGGEYSLRVGQPIFISTDAHEVAAGHLTLFVAGGVRYNDVFNPNERHIFQYAAKYDMAHSYWVTYITHSY